MKKIHMLIGAMGMMLVSAPAYAATVTVTVTPGTNAVSHRIEKQTNGGAFAPLATVPMPTVQHVDSAVTINNTYCYRSVTISAVDESVPSAPCCSALLPAGASAISCTVNP